MTTIVGFIGCGNMGRALLEGWLESGMVKASHVLVSTKSSTKQIAQTYGVMGATVSEVAAQASVVILAVKPQKAATILDSVEFRAGQTVVSVMAGTQSSSLYRYAPAAHIIRVMPNVGCRVGRGATVGFAKSTVPVDITRYVQSLFESVGVFTWLDHEELFHPATALVGSVPAFIFVAIKALVEAAVAEGLSPGAARELAIATVEGTASLAKVDDRSFDELRLSVSSPGGTTVAGLAILEAREFEMSIVDALRAAGARSAELAREAELQ